MFLNESEIVGSIDDHYEIIINPPSCNTYSIVETFLSISLAQSSTKPLSLITPITRNPIYAIGKTPTEATLPFCPLHQGLHLILNEIKVGSMGVHPKSPSLSISNPFVKTQ